MGLGDLSNDKGRGEGVATIACSICLELVTSGGDRSTAKLQCGHEFHLDCIGSAFNAKGVMQCPNCRKVEKGSWLYSSGSRSLPELSIDDWPNDGDLYDLNYAEMPFGIHWCPFSRLARMPSLYEEGESSPSIAFQDLLGYHALFTENPATSSAGHPCPYLTYLQPLQPSSSSNQLVSSESPLDSPPYHHHWANSPAPADIQNHHAVPAVDRHYHGWDHHSQPYSQPSNHSSTPTDHAAVSSTTSRAARLDSEGLPRARSLVHPFILGHGSSSIVSPSIPPYPSNSRVQTHVPDHYQHHNPAGSHAGTIFTSGVRRPGGTRSLPSIVPATAPAPAPAPFSPPDQTSYYLFPPPAASNLGRGRGIQEAENTGGDRFYSWERDRFAPFPLLPIDRESGWWRPFPQSTAGLSDSSTRMGFWHRVHGSAERPSQGRTENSSYRPAHTSRMRPYI